MPEPYPSAFGRDIVSVARRALSAYVMRRCMQLPSVDGDHRLLLLEQQACTKTASFDSGSTGTSPPPVPGLKKTHSTHPRDPSNADRYAYVGHDPANGSDPTGQDYSSRLKDEVCVFACADVGIAYSPQTDRLALLTGVGTGADSDASIDLRTQSGEIENGVSSDFTCGAAYYGGGYGTAGVDTDGTEIYGGGVRGGIGAGCSPGTTKTTVL